jgi:hypothetical protein
MSAGDDIRAFLAPLLPTPPWRHQYGKWVDGATDTRYAVLRRMGGLPAELVRRPEFTLMLIGKENDNEAELEAAADSVVEAMRAGSGALVFMEAGEPVQWPTSDGRAVFEFAITAITN